MPRTDTRKCTKCKQKIEFDLDNISGIVRYNNVFYHSDCFVEYCKGRAAKSSSPLWQQYVNNITPFENAAIEKISYKRDKDDFNEYLLKHYDVIEVQKRFWEVVADLENGKYKQKKCNPVSTKTLFEAWKWGQVKLDSINRKNKMNRTGPKNDEQRILYDLAILVGKIPLFLQVKAKREAEEMERQRQAKERAVINYSNFNTTPKSTEGLDDISALLDEI